MADKETEIQYCEDCENFINSTTDIRYSACKAYETDRSRRFKLVSPKIKREYQYCTITRLHDEKKDTCSKFKPKE